MAEGGAAQFRTAAQVGLAVQDGVAEGVAAQIRAAAQVGVLAAQVGVAEGWRRRLGWRRCWGGGAGYGAVRVAVQVGVAVQVHGGGGAGVAVQVSWAAGCGLPRRHMRGPRPWCVLTVHLDQSALRSRAKRIFVDALVNGRTATRFGLRT